MSAPFDEFGDNASFSLLSLLSRYRFNHSSSSTQVDKEKITVPRFRRRDVPLYVLVERIVRFDARIFAARNDAAVAIAVSTLLLRVSRR